MINTSQPVGDYWEFHAREHASLEAIIHWDALDGPFRWTYAALFNAALNIANRLIEQDVKSQDTCALILRHNKSFYPIYMGICLTGAVPAVVAYPNSRLHPTKFVQGLKGIAEQSGLDWVITQRDIEEVVKPIVSSGTNALKGFLFPLEWDDQGQSMDLTYQQLKDRQGPLEGSESFLLQFSSGTTGLQKGVLLSTKLY